MSIRTGDVRVPPPRPSPELDQRLCVSAARYYKDAGQEFLAAGDILSTGNERMALPHLFNGRRYLSAANNLLKLARQTPADMSELEK